MGSTTIKKIDRIESNASGDVVIAPSSGKMLVESTYIEADNIKKNNLTAVVDPTATDDTGSDYAIGSQWTNTLSGSRFQATDVTLTAAVWLSIGGGGGGGGVDVYINENFESTLAADLTSGNSSQFDNGGSAAANPADETGSPIEGVNSISYTQVSGSLNDWHYFATETMNSRQQNKTNTFIIFNNSDGGDNDIDWVVWDATNLKNLLVSSQGLKVGSTRRTELKFFVPGNCASIKVGFQVKVENIGSKLVFDLAELNTDPFAFTSLTETQDIQYDGQAGYGSTNTKIPYYTTQQKNIGATILEIQNDSTNGISFKALKKCTVEGHFTGGGAGNYSGWSLNSSQLTINFDSVNNIDKVSAGNNFHAGANDSSTASCSFDMEVDDVLRPHLSGVTIPSFLDPQITVLATAQNEAVISNLTEGANLTPYTPTFTGFGTVASIDIKYYKTFHGSTFIAGKFTAGTTTATEAQMTLPSGMVVKSGAPIKIVGHGNISGTGAETYEVLATGDDAYLNFGIGALGVSGLTPANGNVYLGTGVTFSFFCEVEIEGQDIENSVTILSPQIRTAIIIDQKANDVHGGTAAVSTWTDRDINTPESGDTDFYRIVANRIFIASGKTTIEATAPFHGSDYARMRIRDITNGVTIAISSTTNQGAGQNSILVHVSGVVEATEEIEYAIQYLVNQTVNTQDLGKADLTGTDAEVYLRLRLDKHK